MCFIMCKNLRKGFVKMTLVCQFLQNHVNRQILFKKIDPGLVNRENGEKTLS